MTAPDDLDDAARRVLRAQADAASVLDADAVWSRVATGIVRRRHQRQALGVVGTTLVVSGLVLGTQVLQPGGHGPDRDPAGPVVAAAPTSTRAARPVPLTDVTFASTPAQARQAFTDAGYSEQDAWQLALVWRWGAADEVEAVAGLQLLGGGSLPLRPGQDASAAPPGQPGLYRTKVAYGTAGYDDTDARALADRWHEERSLVEVFVGQTILDGDLPAR